MDYLLVPESQFEKNRQLALLKVIHDEMISEDIQHTETFRLVSASITLLEKGGQI